jgi:hypothetical protein
MKQRALALVVAVTAGAVFLPGVAAARMPDLAPLSRQAISTGVQYTKYHWRHSSAAIYVAQVMNNSGASLQVMSAHNLIGAGLETVRSMCARTRGCVAAVNGDFWDVAHPSAAALGGMVMRGELWKSPNYSGQQVSVAPPTPRLTARLGLTWSGELTDKAGTTIKLAGVNTAPAPNATVLYTPRYGRAIGAVGSTSFKAAAPAQLLGRLGRKTPLSGLRAGAAGTRVRAGQAGLVTSGKAATALKQLFRVGGVTLTLSTGEPTSESIGYHPVVMRNGHLTRTDPHDPMLTNANPRTLLAWSPTKTWLVAADGRKNSGPGLTVGEVVTLVRDLGATNAIMLDGGGSTTFEAAGHVLNQPSDGRERSVSNALAVVVPVRPHTVVATPRHRAPAPRHPAPATPAVKPAAGPTTAPHPKPVVRAHRPAATPRHTAPGPNQARSPSRRRSSTRPTRRQPDIRSLGPRRRPLRTARSTPSPRFVRHRRSRCRRRWLRPTTGTRSPSSPPSSCRRAQL